MRYANAMVVKSNKSADRLIDEVNLFLNKVRETDTKGNELIKTKSKTTSSGGTTLKGKKILIVDDDIRNVFALSSALQNFDMFVEIANDGEEAIKKLEEIANIDMVLLDTMMPVMDGYEATRIIRKIYKSDIPIIGLSANAFEDDVEKALAAGMNAHIAKPYSEKEIFNIIKTWLKKAH